MAYAVDCASLSVDFASPDSLVPSRAPFPEFHVESETPVWQFAVGVAADVVSHTGVDFPWDGCCLEDEPLTDAMEAMDALRDAECSASALASLLGEEACPDAVGVPPDSLSEEAVKSADAQTELEPSLYVFGTVWLEGDLATGAAHVQNALREAFLAMLAPVAQVESLLLLRAPVKVAATSEGPIGEAEATGQCTRAFVFRVVAEDPHDGEPLRTTLLVEAQCGGALRLLPLFLEHLSVDEDVMPMRLKIRLHIRELHSGEERDGFAL